MFLIRRLFVVLICVFFATTHVFAGNEPTPTLLWFDNQNNLFKKTDTSTTSILTPATLAGLTFTALHAHPTEPILFIGYSTVDDANNIASLNYDTGEVSRTVVRDILFITPVRNIKTDGNYIYYSLGTSQYKIYKYDMANNFPPVEVISNIPFSEFTLDKVHQKLYYGWPTISMGTHALIPFDLTTNTTLSPIGQFTTDNPIMGFLPGAPFEVVMFDDKKIDAGANGPKIYTVVSEGKDTGSQTPRGQSAWSSVTDLVADPIGRDVYIVHDSGTRITKINVDTHQETQIEVLQVTQVRSVAFSNLFEGQGDGGSDGGEDGDDGGDDPEDDGCTDFSDADGDGTPRCEENCTVTESNDCIADECPYDPSQIVEMCGCDVDDLINEKFKEQNETACQIVDNCPDTNNQLEPGVCGCDGPYVETGDPAIVCKDECPNDDNKTEAGVCGCGKLDTIISPETGEPDCFDECPNNSDKQYKGDCGCATPDIDTDGDGVKDCNDGCPRNANRTEPGPCGCQGTAIVKADNQIICKPQVQIPNSSKSGKTIINPIDGSILTPDPLDLTINQECGKSCKVVFDFPKYTFVNIGSEVLAGKRKNKKRNKVKLKATYEITLNQISSKKTRTSKRNTKRNRLAVKKLSPGTNYIVSYKLKATKKTKNGRERTVATSASSKSISFRTPGS